MQFVDSHCHLQFSVISKSLDMIFDKAKEAGITHFVVNSTSVDDISDVKRLSESKEYVYPCFGIHPYNIKENNIDADLDKLFRFCDNYKGVFQIGEIGLDKSIESRIPMYLQEMTFRQQITYANRKNVSFSVHCVKSIKTVMRVLEETKPFPFGFLMHGYSGPPDYVKGLAIIGAYFSISGYLFNLSPNRRKAMEDTIRKIPMDRILFESDSPDMIIKNFVTENTLRDADGHVANTPLSILHICEEVAKIRGISVLQMASIAYANSHRFFLL